MKDTVTRLDYCQYLPVQRQDLILGLPPSAMYVGKSFRGMLILILSADAALANISISVFDEPESAPTKCLSRISPQPGKQ